MVLWQRTCPWIRYKRDNDINQLLINFCYSFMALTSQKWNDDQVHVRLNGVEHEDAEIKWQYSIGGDGCLSELHGYGEAANQGALDNVARRVYEVGESESKKFIVIRW